MKKKSMKRLFLNRETVVALEPGRLGPLAEALGGSTNYSQVVAGYCCSTVTSPVQSPSGYCRSANTECETMATCAG